MTPKSRYPVRQIEKLKLAGAKKVRLWQTSEIRKKVRVIRGNWPKGTKLLASATVISGKNMARVGGDEMPSALKKTMPYMPLEVVRIIRYDSKLRPGLNDAILKATHGVLPTGVTSTKVRGHKSNGLNTGSLRGQAAKVVFFPHHAVQQVYTPEIIRGLAKYGIKKEALMRWSHSPQYIDEQWRRPRRIRLMGRR